MKEVNKKKLRDLIEVAVALSIIGVPIFVAGFMVVLSSNWYCLLVKWLNTLPSQCNIHGFEFRTGYHNEIKSLVYLKIFLF